MQKFEINEDLKINEYMLEKNVDNNSMSANNITINNGNERKSVNSFLGEKNQYKRLLEDSYIKIESYKRIIEQKDEDIIEMKKNIEDLKRKNNQFENEMTDMKKNYNL